MPVLDLLERLPCASILVPEGRQRSLIETEDLEPSIRARGVVTPIIVHRADDGSAVLVAGQRRLTASIRLGLPDIPVRWSEDLSETELQIIELEENVKRQDLPWQDRIRAIGRIHRLYLSLDPDWTMTETAANVSLTLGAVSMYLRVEGELGDDRITASGTIREAWNVLARRDAREQGNALEELLEVPGLAPGDDAAEADADAEPVEGSPESWIGGVVPPQQRVVAATPAPPLDPILHESFLTFAPAYSGPKFNFIHCDFPYGKDVFSGPQARGSDPGKLYGDELGTYFALLETLCTALPRLMSLSGHLMFWCGSEITSPESPYARETWRRFRELAPSLEFRPFPLIWVKSDNSGIASDPRHGPRHVYETCLLASRGGKQIVKVVSDAYSSPSDHKLHPSTKPEPMLRHFFSMLVDGTSAVLDPTAGSGAALRAADSLGAGRLLGLEIDEGYVRSGNQEFRARRLLRTAERSGA